MVYEHNYASCEDPLCQRCEDYGIGYARGKEKALFEVRNMLDSKVWPCKRPGCEHLAGSWRDLQQHYSVHIEAESGPLKE